MPSWLVGALAGLATGVIASFVLGVVTIMAKRARNARLDARGEPGIKDVVFVPLYGLYGPAGALVGGIAAGIDGEGALLTGILGGLALPVLLTAVMLVAIVAQMFGRG
jgi:hypothetical protein